MTSFLSIWRWAEFASSFGPSPGPEVAAAERFINWWARATITQLPPSYERWIQSIHIFWCEMSFHLG